MRGLELDPSLNRLERLAGLQLKGEMLRSGRLGEVRVLVLTSAEMVAVVQALDDQDRGV